MNLTLFNHFVSFPIKNHEITECIKQSSHKTLFFINKIGTMSLNVSSKFNNENVLLNCLYENKFEEVDNYNLLMAYLLFFHYRHLKL